LSFRTHAVIIGSESAVHLASTHREPANVRVAAPEHQVWPPGI
jgi:hypothetical protein